LSLLGRMTSIFKRRPAPTRAPAAGGPRPQASVSPPAFLESRREHSRKPEQGYVDAAAMAGPYPKADIFAREQRPGWDAWGNEINKFANDNQPAEIAA